MKDDIFHNQLNLSKILASEMAISSLLTSTLATFLSSKWHEAYIDKIESVKARLPKITIKTGIPILNAELSLYRDDLLELFRDTLKRFGYSGPISIIFR